MPADWLVTTKTPGIFACVVEEVNEDVLGTAETSVGEDEVVVVGAAEKTAVADKDAGAGAAPAAAGASWAPTLTPVFAYATATDTSSPVDASTHLPEGYSTL